MSNKTFQRRNFKIYDSLPFRKVLRLESERKVYVPVAGITNTAPVEISTSTPHNLPEGWRVKVTGVNRMPELAKYNPVSNVSPGTFVINNINTTEHKPYESGGIVEFFEPLDLDNIRIVLSIHTTAGELVEEINSDSDHIALDNVDKIVLIDTDIDMDGASRLKYTIVGERTDISYNFPILAGYFLTSRW